LVLFLYNLMFPLALLAMLPGAIKKMKARGGRWSDLWQRLGFFEPRMREELTRFRERGPVVWVHAVSVGEVGIAAKLVRELARRQPALGVVLTSTTPTGIAQARQLAQELPGVVLPLYSALDGWFTVRRFLGAIRPQQVVLVEAEVWPNLVSAASRRGIAVSLVNARLSPRSERRYRSLRAVVGPVFRLLTRVLVQEPEDVARWTSLGMPGTRVICTGSVKFDQAGDQEPTAQIAAFRALLLLAGVSGDRLVLLAASTHAGEEVELARVFLQLRARHPALYFILVPRHVERAPEILSDLAALGLHVRLRSHLGGLETEKERLAETEEAPPQEGPGCLLVDTTGELRAWQALATLVVVGKSFLATGGQNPAEAVMAGKPVLFGPHMENFDALVRVLLARGGAVQVPDFAALEQELDAMLREPARADRIAEAGHDALQAHKGATSRTADLLLL
jgi:3-deoxy-D-manno-octulosonic-acid transferase